MSYNNILSWTAEKLQLIGNAILTHVKVPLYTRICQRHEQEIETQLLWLSKLQFGGDHLNYATIKVKIMFVYNSVNSCTSLCTTWKFLVMYIVHTEFYITDTFFCASKYSQSLISAWSFNNSSGLSGSPLPRRLYDIVSHCMAFENLDKMSSSMCMYFASFFPLEDLSCVFDEELFITPLTRNIVTTPKTPAAPIPMLKSALCTCWYREAMFCVYSGGNLYTWYLLRPPKYMKFE
jgi:hypothetical protein